MRIGIDLMGGDRSPHELFQGVIQAYHELAKEVSFVVITTHDLFSEFQKILSSYDFRIEFVTVSEAIERHEPPLLAVRRKKNSSLAAGIKLIKEKRIDAFVSTGNTGALVATAMLHLNKLPQIEQAALLARLPTLIGDVAALDVGANITSLPHHLVQFAQLGMLYRRVIYPHQIPRIGLLNIGAEKIKGTQQVKVSYEALASFFKDSQEGVFIGNVEGREIFQGACDVLIADGFTGNVFLKTAEGVSSFLLEYLKETSIASLLPLQFDYSQSPGAFLCGVDGVIIKCHGNASATILAQGIKNAYFHAKHHISDAMKQMLAP